MQKKMCTRNLGVCKCVCIGSHASYEEAWISYLYSLFGSEICDSQ